MPYTLYPALKQRASLDNDNTNCSCLLYFVVSYFDKLVSECNSMLNNWVALQGSYVEGMGLKDLKIWLHVGKYDALCFWHCKVRVGSGMGGWDKNPSGDIGINTVQRIKTTFSGLFTST